MTGSDSSEMEPDLLHRNDLYLAIDQGGHSSRTLIFNHEGQLLAEGHAEVSVDRPRSGYVEQDPDEVLNSIHVSMAQALDVLGEQCQQIAAAGLATQRSTVACWDRHSGQALTPLISWQDRRAHQWLQQFRHQAHRVHQATGLFLSAHYGASKLRWCLDNIPAVKQAYDENRLAFGPLASFLIYRLLEEKPLLVDPVNASRTLLWNINKRDWDASLAEMFGLPIDPLPRCVPNCFDFGTVVAGDARIPLRFVSGDQSAAMFAYGKLLPDTAYVNVGTGAFVSRSLGHYPAYGRRLLTGIILEQQNEATYVLEGTVNGAGSALDWAAQHLDLGDVFEHLAEWLARETSPPLFLNGVSGLGAPFWIPDFESRFVGAGEPWQKMVAVVESIVFLLQANISEMRSLSSPPQCIRLSGGLSRLNGLCSRLADLTGLPVYRPQEREATARGLAYLMAGCPDYWPETQLGDWFKPAQNPGLQARYTRWLEMLLAAMRRPQS